MKEIMDNIVKVICDYLRINEDLFFCAKRQPRIMEARKYFCYFAHKIEKIPAVKVSRYFMTGSHSSKRILESTTSVINMVRYDKSSQAANDVDAITELLKEKI
jgi:chromosomal replication initiation ATPase DnaA